MNFYFIDCSLFVLFLSRKDKKKKKKTDRLVSWNNVDATEVFLLSKYIGWFPTNYLKFKITAAAAIKSSPRLITMGYFQQTLILNFYDCMDQMNKIFNRFIGRYDFIDNHFSFHISEVNVL